MAKVLKSDQEQLPVEHQKDHGNGERRMPIMNASRNSGLV